MKTLVNTLTETELDGVCGGRGGHLSMIELQSVLSQRGVTLRLITGMLNAMNNATSSIIKNIR